MVVVSSTVRRGGTGADPHVLADGVSPNNGDSEGEHRHVTPALNSDDAVGRARAQPPRAQKGARRRSYSGSSRSATA